MATETKHRNGMDLDYIGGMIEGIRHEPAAGIVVSRVRHRWDDGFAVDGAVESLEQAGEVISRKHTFRTDWPQPFGDDTGPTPGVESILGALGACVATTYAFKASLRGVRIDELEVITEAEIDLRGLLEADAGTAARFSRIDVTVRVHSDADDMALAELGETCIRTSPTFDSLANPVPIRLGVRRLD